jgi:hypothetical protein
MSANEKAALVIIGGGLLLTLISGLYVVEPFTIYSDTFDYGFPLAWFETTRSSFFKLGEPFIGPLHYYFLWWGFIVDFLLYGLLIAAATYVYFIAR